MMMPHFARYAVLFISTVSACVVAGGAFPGQTSQKPRVEIAGKVFEVEIANTREKRALGLSGRTHLENNTGMLFIFKNDNRHGFWMRNMHFPLDILWINQFGRVVHIEKNVLPESWPGTFAPKKPARYVLEVRAGQLSHVTAGDQAHFKMVQLRAH